MFRVILNSLPKVADQSRIIVSTGFKTVAYKMSDGQQWRRPDSAPFPVVWRRFERRDAQDKTKIRKFRVQDVPLDDDKFKDELVQHMTVHFLRDEPTCAALHLLDEPESVQEAQSIWRWQLEQRCVLACLEENQNGDVIKSPQTGVPIVIGCNFTYVVNKGEKNPKAKGKCLRTICEAMDYLGTFMDPYQHYGVDRYLYAFGLSVDPEYRGMGIGQEILKARNDLGLKLGLKATVTVFTAITSQKVAEHCGYEVLAEKSYEEIEKHDARFKFPGITTKTMKIMGRKLDVVLP